MIDININQVVLTGRITNTITLKTSKNGISYATFTLVVNKPSEKGANYVNCIAWGKVANEIEGLDKNSYLGVIGSIETSKNKETDTTLVNVSVSKVYLPFKNNAKNEAPEPTYDDVMSKATATDYENFF